MKSKNLNRNVLENKLKKDYRYHLNKIDNSLSSDFLELLYEEYINLCHTEYCSIVDIYNEIEQIYLKFLKSTTIHNNIYKTTIDKQKLFLDTYKKFMFLPMHNSANTIFKNSFTILKDELKEIKKIELVAKNLRLNSTYNQIIFNNNLLIKKITYIHVEIIHEIHKEYCKSIYEMLKQIRQMLKIMNIINDSTIESEINNIENMICNTNSQDKFEKLFKVRDIENFLHENNFEKVRQTGGHKIYKKGSNVIPIPFHSKEIKKGLSLSIQKQVHKINSEIK